MYFSLELPISEENRSIHDNFTESFDVVAYFPTRRKRSRSRRLRFMRNYSRWYARATRAECNRTHKENPLRSRSELSIKASDRSIEINRALDRAENFNRRWRRFHPSARRSLNFSPRNTQEMAVLTTISCAARVQNAGREDDGSRNFPERDLALSIRGPFFTGDIRPAGHLIPGTRESELKSGRQMDDEHKSRYVAHVPEMPRIYSGSGAFVETVNGTGVLIITADKSKIYNRPLWSRSILRTIYLEINCKPFNG